MHQLNALRDGMKKRRLYEDYFKRPIDFIVALIALVAFSPIFVIVSILVRIYLGKPVIFKQDRPGYKGKVFTLYKFRTMTDKKDSEGNLLPNELRLTSFGKTLRSTSLDELPELVNIIKGDMSIVGPRPLLVEYLSLYNSFQKRRHEVRPGLTGLAQTMGRNTIEWDEKFNYDIQYVDNITFLGDIKILLMTLKTVFTREGINFSENRKSNKFTG